MKIIFFLLFFFCILSVSFAQKNRSNVFILGDKKELNFSTEPPTLQKDGIGSCYSHICDKQGNLILVTGVNVLANSKLNIICRDTFRATIVVPNPIQDQVYYWFLGLPSSSCYHTVDMSQNNGEGKVYEKKNLYSGIGNAYTFSVVYHKDINWLLYIVDGKVLSFKIDKDGVNTNPVISMVLPNAKRYGYSILPNMAGTKILIRKELASVLYDFDKTSGKLSNPFDLGIQATAYEFSSDGKFLYTIEPNPVDTLKYILYQYKIELLSTKAISQSKKEIATGVYGYERAMGLAPNGKIYIFESIMNFLAVINQPNEEGVLCDFQNRSISFSGFGAGGTIPIMHRGTYYELPEIRVENTCYHFPTFFSLSKNMQSALWSFGDGSTSTDLNPSHTYANKGIYTVKVLANYPDGSSQTLTKTITIEDKPTTKLSILHR